MPLIDHTYFSTPGEVFLPNTERTDVQERIDYQIASLEDKFLQDILGYPLWKAMNDGLSQMVIDQKWLDLRDGKEYTGIDDQPHAWMGLRQVYTSAPFTIKKSMIANLVYWYWQKENSTQTVSLGEAAPNAENATIVSPKPKMIAAWNQMVDWICDLQYFLDSNISVYPEWQNRYNFFQMRNYRKQNPFDI